MNDLVSSESEQKRHRVDAQTVEAIDQCSHCFSQISANISRIVLGQDEVVDHVLQCLIANGARIT